MILPILDGWKTNKDERTGDPVVEHIVQCRGHFVQVDEMRNPGNKGAEDGKDTEASSRLPLFCAHDLGCKWDGEAVVSRSSGCKPRWKLREVFDV